MMFSLSSVGGSKSAEGGPYPLADLDRGVQIRQDTGAIAVIIKNARHSFSARKMNQGYPEYAEMFGALWLGDLTLVRPFGFVSIF